MPSMVTYTDQQSAANRYPDRIISPPQAGACCFSEMADVGPPKTDARWVYQYRRCRQCGIAVRVILCEIPDAALVASLPESLARSFMRNLPE
jgi:hypothetical protein